MYFRLLDLRFNQDLFHPATFFGGVKQKTEIRLHSYGKAWFIRRISAVSNAVETIDNEMICFIIFCLNCIRHARNATYEPGLNGNIAKEKVYSNKNPSIVLHVAKSRIWPRLERRLREKNNVKRKRSISKLCIFWTRTMTVNL